MPPTVLDANWAGDADGISDYAFTHGHQGGQLDPDTGLIHFRNRDYSRTLGRWVQQDPLGYVDGGSLYNALASAPTFQLDLLGTTVTFFFETPMYAPRPMVVPRPAPRPMLVPRPTPRPTPGPATGTPRPSVSSGRPGSIDIGPIGMDSDRLFPIPDHMLPDREGDYGFSHPRPYVKPQEPCDEKDPCAKLRESYKRIQTTEIEKFWKDIGGRKTELNCQQAMRYYDLLAEVWRLRAETDDCKLQHGMADGKHGLATQEAAQARSNAYHRMKVICNEGFRNRPPAPVDQFGNVWA